MIDLLMHERGIISTINKVRIKFVSMHLFIISGASNSHSLTRWFEIGWMTPAARYCWVNICISFVYSQKNPILQDNKTSTYIEKRRDHDTSLHDSGVCSVEIPT